MSYKQLFNYENALKYYSKAYEITKDSLSKDAVMNNIALIYMDQKEYAKAIKILRRLVFKKKARYKHRIQSQSYGQSGVFLFSLRRQKRP
ncbi:tetratricopeptide repeat protein [Flavobacterium lindanitolerans]|nr:tetratricopeptide repeat protein [Flavobacterium lindanitolerans]